MLPCFFNLCDTLSSNETTAYQVWQPKVCWCIKWRTEGFSSCLKSAIQTSVQACLMTMNCYKPSLDRYHYQANRLMMTDCYKPSLDRYQVNRLMMTDCYKPSPDRYHYQANCLMMMDCYKPSLDRYHANSFLLLQDLKNSMWPWPETLWKTLLLMIMHHHKTSVKTLAVWKILSRPNFDTRIQKHADKHNN